MRIVYHQATYRRHRQERFSVERRQGGMVGTRAEAWLDESEVAHARHLVVELQDVESETRGDAPVARGMPMGVSTRTASARAAQAPLVHV